jgi:two-component system KDP operon response regulator KdpE
MLSEPRPVPRILIIDDEPQIRRFIRISLAADGYAPIEAAGGTEGLERVVQDRPDLVILDLGLPDMDGQQVLSRIRELSPVPVIVLSVRAGEAEKVEALDRGANDYVTKPFGIDELMARIRVALRVPVGEEAPTVVTADFTIDLASKRVTRDGNDVRLTATEWQIVEILVRNPGKLVTQKQLLEQVWGLEDPKTNYVRVFMVAIRKKLEPDPAHPRYFITEPGSGLRFMFEPTDGASGPDD